MSVKLTLNGPFPALHPRLADLEDANAAESNYNRAAANIFLQSDLSRNPNGHNLGPEEMRELVDYVRNQHNNLSNVLRIVSQSARRVNSEKKA